MAKNRDIPQIRFKGFVDTWEQRKAIDIADYSKEMATQKAIWLTPEPQSFCMADFTPSTSLQSVKWTLLQFPEMVRFTVKETKS